MTALVTALLALAALLLAPVSSPAQAPPPTPNDCLRFPFPAGQLPDTTCGINVRALYESAIRDNLVSIRTTPKNAGSGFLVMKEQKCFIVTANHVVRQWQSANVTLRHGATLQRTTATVVARDLGTDLAALQVDADIDGGCRGIEIAADDSLPAVGEGIVAAGFPLDSPLPIVTPGTLVSTNEPLKPEWLLPGERADLEAIACEHPIFPGNSGGLLVSKQGKLIGVLNHSNTVNRSYAVRPEHIRALLAKVPASGGK